MTEVLVWENGVPRLKEVTALSRVQLEEAFETLSLRLQNAQKDTFQMAQGLARCDAQLRKVEGYSRDVGCILGEIAVALGLEPRKTSQELTTLEPAARQLAYAEDLLLRIVQAKNTV